MAEMKNNGSIGKSGDLFIFLLTFTWFQCFSQLYWPIRIDCSQDDHNQVFVGFYNVPDGCVGAPCPYFLSADSEDFKGLLTIPEGIAVYGDGSHSLTLEEHNGDNDLSFHEDEFHFFRVHPSGTFSLMRIESVTIRNIRATRLADHTSHLLNKNGQSSVLFFISFVHNQAF